MTDREDLQAPFKHPVRDTQLWVNGQIGFALLLVALLAAILQIGVPAAMAIVGVWFMLPLVIRGFGQKRKGGDA